MRSSRRIRSRLRNNTRSRLRLRHGSTGFSMHSAALNLFVRLGQGTACLETSLTGPAPLPGKACYLQTMRASGVAGLKFRQSPAFSTFD